MYERKNFVPCLLRRWASDACRTLTIYVSGGYYDAFFHIIVCYLRTVSKFSLHDNLCFANLAR